MVVGLALLAPHWQAQTQTALEAGRDLAFDLVSLNATLEEQALQRECGPLTPKFRVIHLQPG